MKIDPLPIGIYRHFKGNYYVLKGFATMQSGHAEGAQLAVYASTCGGATHCRSIDNFKERVQIDEDGTLVSVPRFEFQEKLTRLVLSFNDSIQRHKRRAI